MGTKPVNKREGVAAKTKAFVLFGRHLGLSWGKNKTGLLVHPGKEVVAPLLKTRMGVRVVKYVFGHGMSNDLNIGPYKALNAIEMVGMVVRNHDQLHLLATGLFNKFSELCTQGRCA